MKSIRFYDYQDVKNESALRYLEILRSVLLEEPTGSGKTLQGVTILAMAMTRKIATHAIVIAPQRQIEEGFLGKNEWIIHRSDKSPKQEPIAIPARFVRPARRGKEGSVREILAYLATPNPCYALATTHQALTYLHCEHKDDLPASLARCILFVDEAHHVPADSLSKAVDEWEERGGLLIYATATPFGRADGRSVKRDNMVALRRSLAEHMEEGYAPRHIHNEIVPIGAKGDIVTPAEFNGNIVGDSPSSHEEIAAAFVEKWKQDKRPKLIVRVPPAKGGSWPLVALLLKRFAEADARVLCLAGVGNRAQKRVLAALEAERKAFEADPSRAFESSRYDVVIGCQRVKEGTDWPVCSHVYSYGIPDSLGAVIQLLGRAMRKKTDAHPSRDVAKIVFFVPCAGGDALEQLSLEHSRHVLKVCVFLADHETGKDWIVTQAVRAAAGSKPSDSREPEIDEALKVPDDVYAEARLHLTVAQEENPLISFGEAIEAVQAAMPNANHRDIVNVVSRQLAGDQGRVGQRYRKRLEEELRERTQSDETGFRPEIAKSLRETFDALVEEFRAETLVDPSDSLAAQIHRMTGGKMLAMTQRLKGACPGPLTEEWIVNEIRKWKDRTGRFPSCSSGHIPGTQENWANINLCLVGGWRSLSGGSSLARLKTKYFGTPYSHERNYRRSLPVLPPFDREAVRQWVLAFMSQNDGLRPTSNSGEIPGAGGATWRQLDSAMRHSRQGWSGGTLTSFLANEFGVRNRGSLPPFTVEQVDDWVRLYIQEHGKPPSTSSGVIPDSNGETWYTVDRGFRRSSRCPTYYASLAHFLRERFGVRNRRDLPRLTIPLVVQWVKDHLMQHGSFPTQDSGEIPGSNGETWKKVWNAARSGQRGLPKGTNLSKIIAKHFAVRAGSKKKSPRQPAACDRVGLTSVQSPTPWSCLNL